MNSVLTLTDFGLIQQALDDWRFIRDEYKESLERGLAAYAGKNDRCGLCAAYRKIARQAGGQYVLSCRMCPVVKVWRRTCVGLRERAGIANDFFKDRGCAIVAVGQITHALEGLVDMDRRAFLLWAI